MCVDAGPRSTVDSALDIHEIWLQSRGREFKPQLGHITFVRVEAGPEMDDFQGLCLPITDLRVSGENMCTSDDWLLTA